jgi:Rha family phage regulatory protein
MAEGNQPMTDSRKVAKKFERSHRYVLQRIRELIADLPSDEGMQLFEHTPYVEAQNGQTYDCYQMTKDGFMLLVMGFTGKKALAVKLAFIKAFNAMAEHLRTGLWRRRIDAEAEFLAGKDQASIDGRGLCRWRHEKPLHVALIADLDRQMQLPLSFEVTQ